MIESSAKEKTTNICIGSLLWIYEARLPYFSYVLITRVHHLKFLKSSWNVDVIPKLLHLDTMKYVGWMLHTQ